MTANKYDSDIYRQTGDLEDNNLKRSPFRSHTD